MARSQELTEEFKTAHRNKKNTVWEYQMDWTGSSVGPMAGFMKAVKNLQVQ
jgi:hypothetical protein